MATQTTDTSSSEEEIYYTKERYTYYSSTECESDYFEYEGKAGYINTCDPEYSKEELGKLGNYFLNFISVDRVVDFFNNSFYVRTCSQNSTLNIVKDRTEGVFLFTDLYA